MRILAAYAHPDDECFCSGGTLATYTAAGAEALVISATPGDAGQIHDSYNTTRQTLGSTRARELEDSCAALGVQHVQCWDYPDGSLAHVDITEVVDRLVTTMTEFQPDVVLTFGHDGGYGHPDHIAISYATEEAVRRINEDSTNTIIRLYFAYFPQKEMLLVEELSNWLMTKDLHYRESLDFLKALSIFAEESTMLRYSSDFVDTNWYPPGFCIIEQGEQSNKLYVILSGKVDVMREADAGSLEPIAQLGVGQFFGETGIARQQARNAYVIAHDATTCLEFAYQQPTLFEGRGEEALQNGEQEAPIRPLERIHATHVIDVREHILQKIEAIGCHRTQFPITPSMFPRDMLKRLFGQEYYVRIYPEFEMQTQL
ncbi:MAG: hypothetical protein CL607_23450 [Anaerolineaceae bacterium]|nr:hypothetical protein [Anaerolineaceae bacterium]